MSAFRFIHCGDIHMDARFTSTGLSDIKAKIRRKEIMESFGRIITLAEKENIDAILIAGDLFEHEYVRPYTIDYIVNQIKRISDTSVFICPGNHDPYVKNSYYNLANWPENVYIFNHGIEKVELKEKDIVIIGKGFSSKYIYKSTVNDIDYTINNKKRILITHGTVGGNPNECKYHPINIDRISSNFDYIALGHFHQFNKIKSNAAYCGSPEPLGFDELGSHGIIVGEINSNGVIYEFVPLSKRHFIIKDIDCSTLSSLEEIMNMIKDAIYKNNNNLLRIILSGYRVNNVNINVEELEAMFKDNCFYLNINDETKPYLDFKSLRRDKNIKGIFIDRILTDIEKEKDIEARKKLYKALYMGISALDS